MPGGGRRSPSQVEGGERALVEGSGMRRRERSQVEEIIFRWREAMQGGGKRSQVEESCLRWRKAVSGRGKRSQAEESLLRK